MSLSLRNREEYDWDFALIKSKENPFPLAPTDLVHKGLVNEANYKQANKRWSEVWNGQITRQLYFVADSSPGGRIDYLSSGSGRELGSVENAIKLGLCVHIRDKSAVACATALRLKWRLRLENLSVSQGSVETWDNWIHDDGKTVARVGSQFFQNQDPQVMKQMMLNNGNFLKMMPQKRAVYIIHPLGEDNPEGNVEWKNTLPYTEAELRTPLELGFGGPVKIRVLHKHKYFDHQTYTLYKITAA